MTRPVIVAGLASDAHTWNLICIELVLEELGCPVVNLGPCLPDAELVAEAVRLRPALVVFSTVNGHGYADGRRVIRALRCAPCLAGTPVVIGGKLGVDGSGAGAGADGLLRAGFDAVFGEGPRELARFRGFVTGLTRDPVRSRPRPAGAEPVRSPAASVATRPDGS